MMKAYNTPDDLEADAIALFQTTQSIRARTAHLVRCINSAACAGDYERLEVLARRLRRTATAGQIAAAEARGDVARADELNHRLASVAA